MSELCSVTHHPFEGDAVVEGVWWVSVVNLSACTSLPDETRKSHNAPHDAIMLAGSVFDTTDNSDCDAPCLQATLPGGDLAHLSV